MSDTTPSCEKCERYMRVVDRHGKTSGYVCDEWLHGIVGTGMDWFPCESCFEQRKYKKQQQQTDI